jgi:hypothetical protein
MEHFTPIKTRKKLVTSLIVPQFLYCDVVFSKTTLGLQEKLKVAFNIMCKIHLRCVLSRNQHISQYMNRILGVSLDTYYSYRMCCVMFELIRTGGPRYLFDRIQFDQTSPVVYLILLHQHTGRPHRISSFFVQGAILCNGLPIVRGDLGKGACQVCVGLRVVEVDAADAKYIYTENTVVFTSRISHKVRLAKLIALQLTIHPAILNTSESFKK